MEVLFEDYLERCVSANKKEYKKSYFVFRQDGSGSKTLEYFKDSNWRKNEPRGVCNLFNGYSVGAMGLHETKKKFGIILKTVGKTFELHASSEKLKEKWIEVLDKDIESFHLAKLLESPPNAYSSVRSLNGQLHLQITDCSVVLLCNRVPSISWRFGTIRRYKSKDGAFVLEVGRKAPTGEGIFRFHVPNPNTLFDDLDKALKERIILKRNQDSSIDTIQNENIYRRSVNIRQQSMEERPLPPDPPAYNTLGLTSMNNSVSGDSEVNGYDKLFGSTPPKQLTPLQYPSLNHFNSLSIIGKKDKLDEDNFDENYIDMSGIKTEILKECKNLSEVLETRPRPVPRPPSNVSSEIPMSSSPCTLRSVDVNNVDKPYSNPDVDLIDLNTYDCPSTLDLTTISNDQNLNEYHTLNNHTPPKSFDSAVVYDHLSHMYTSKDNPNTHKGFFNITDDKCKNAIEDVYDSPKLQSEPPRDIVNRKPPPPPIPSRPFSSSRRPFRSIDRISSCESYPDTVLVLGKSSNQLNLSSVSSDTLYDSPRCNSQNNNSNPRNAFSMNLDDMHHLNSTPNEIYQVPRVDGL